MCIVFCLLVLVTAHNWQNEKKKKNEKKNRKRKRKQNRDYSHVPALRVNAVDLCFFNYTISITIFVNVRNLGQIREYLIFDI